MKKEKNKSKMLGLAIITLFTLMALSLASSNVRATVTITAIDMGGGVVAIDYESDEPELIRAFALDITVDSGTIDAIADYAVGDDNYGYGIFPGNFARYIIVDPVTGEVVDWDVAGYTPVADPADPGALGGLGTSGITIEMGSLYETKAPDDSGRLFTLTVSESCKLSVGLNAARGNVVLEDGTEPMVDLSGATDFDITVPPSPVCYCYNCSDCTAKLNDPNCTTVYLTANISNHTGTCIDNPANFLNKTFDCQGNTIDGTGSGNGIYIDEKLNNTIKNCIITNFSIGISLVTSYFNNITDNTVNNNNHTGISLVIFSIGNNITNNIVNKNNDYGIRLWATSANNNIISNTAKLNGLYGIYVDGSESTGNIFTSNNLCTNNDSSYDLYDEDANTFSDNYCDSGRKYTNSQALNCDYTCTGACTCVNCDDCENKLNDPSCTTVLLTANITNHGGTCIDSPANFSNKTFDCQGNTIDGIVTGGDYGIYLNGKSNNTIKNCIITEFSRGICLYSSSNNSITNNTANSNFYEGIYLTLSSNNIITNNIANSNDGYAGICLFSSSNNIITNNTAKLNWDYGIGVFDSESTGNIFTFNNLCTNSHSSYDINDDDVNTFTDNYCNPGRKFTNGSAQSCDNACAPPACYCYNCSDCMEKLNDPSCQIVYLAQNITSNGTCIDNPINFSNKTFDCQGHTIEYATTKAGHGIWSSSPPGFNATVRNCIIKAAAGSFNYCGGSNPSCYGIYWNTYDGVIEHNTITTVGNGYPNSNDGINLVASGNKVLKNNITTTAGRGLGIKLSSCRDSNITMNRITTMGGVLSDGIHIYGGSSNIIDRNNIVTYSGSDGVSISGSPNNVITNNNITSHGSRAIRASFTNSTIIIANHLTTTGEWTGGADGIALGYSLNMTIKDNIMDTVGWAISFGYWDHSKDPQHYNHTIENNTERGEPIDYYFDNDSTTIEDIDYIGQLIVACSRNVTIKNMSLDKDGIILALVENSTVKGSNITFSNESWGITGIFLLSSDYNNATDNNITTPTGSNPNAISLYSSSNNSIESSNIYGWGRGGIIYVCASSNDNIIQSNNITTTYHFGTGIGLHSCSGNDIADNSIITHNELSNSISLYLSTFNKVLGNRITTTHSYRTEGLWLGNSANNSITANIFDNADKAIKIEGSANDVFKHNIIKGSEVNFSFSYSGDIEIKKVSTPPADPPDYINISKYLDITNQTPAWMFLNISYNESELGNVSEDSLRIWKHNGTRWNETFYSERGINVAQDYVYANITSFSIFAPLGQSAPTCPYYVNADWNLTENISCPATALIANASNIIIDCQGHSINYSSADVGYGIFAQHKNNITIKNCKIMQTNSSGVCQNDSIGIFFNCYASACSNINILNNSVRVCGDETNASTEGNYAMTLRQLWDSNLIGNDVTSIKYSGIKLTGRSKRCLVKANRVTSPGHAIYFHAEKVYDSIVENNNVTSTNWVGIFVHAGTGNVIRNNLVNDSHDGIGSWGNNTTIINNNITTFGYGITISKNANNNITGNNITGNNAGSGISLGWLYLGDYFPSNNNIIQHNLISNFKEGIHLEANSENNNIRDNNITISSNNGYGVYTDNSSDNNATSNNIITTGNYGHGIYLYSSSNNNLVTGNNITTAGNNAYGIYLDYNSNSNIIKNNIIGTNLNMANAWAIYIENSADNTFEHDIIKGSDVNISFSYSGNIKIKGVEEADKPYHPKNISKYLNITNTTAAWLFLNISYDDSEVSHVTEKFLRIWKHNGTWYPVPVSDVDMSGNVVYANITKFSIFAPLGLACPYYVNENLTLNENISCPATALIANASNIIIDCQGHSINYSESGIGHGIDASRNVSGITIKNCVIKQTASFDNSSAIIFGDYYYHSTNNVIKNNTIATRGGNMSDCMNIRKSFDSNISDNNLFTTGSIGRGIVLRWGSSRNIIKDNTIDTVSAGVYFHDNNANNKIIENSITRGGIHLSLSPNNTVKRNQVNGTIALQYSTSIGNQIIENNISNSYPNGIGVSIFGLLGQGRNNITGNNIVTAGSFGYGIYLSNTTNNNIVDNDITTFNRDSSGIYLYSNSNSNTINDNNITTAGIDAYGIYLSAALNNKFTDNVVKSAQSWDFYSVSDSLNNTVINLTMDHLSNPVVSFESKDIAMRAAASSEITDQLPAHWYRIGPYVNATNNSADSWIFLNITYNESNIPLGKSESEIRLWEWDNGWPSNYISGSGVNAAHNYVYGSKTGFSIFTPLVYYHKAGPYDINVYLTLSNESICLGDSINLTCEVEADRDVKNVALNATEQTKIKDWNCTYDNLYDEANCSAIYKPTIQGTHTFVCEAEDIGGKTANDTKYLTASICAAGNCSDLQAMSFNAEISWHDTNGEVMLNWDADALLNAVATIPEATFTNFEIKHVERCRGNNCENNDPKITEEIWNIAEYGEKDINARNWQGYDPERLSFYQVIANVDFQEGGLSVRCPIKSPVFVKFSQDLKLGQDPTKNTSINWIVNFLPDTTEDIVYQNPPIVTSSARLLELADCGGGGPPFYNFMWPSQERFNESTQTKFSSEPMFRGPYVSVWNPTLQREVYGTAWGMNIKTDLPESVGSMEMQEGMPYFISPDAEGVVTWVGGVPEAKVFELKYGAPESDHENYIILPLNTMITNSTELCNLTDQSGNRIINSSTSLGLWNLSTQKVDYSRHRCTDYIRRPDRAFELEPGKVYKIFAEQDTIWKQK